MEFRRKLYTRGSSYETTIPMPLLFSLDKNKKHEIVFIFEPETDRWFIKVEEQKQAQAKKLRQRKYKEKDKVKNE